jgi:hypothetical protein
MLARFPEAEQRSAKAHRPLRIPALNQVINRQAKILVLDLELVKPFGLRGNIFGSFFGKDKVISGVRPPSG